MDWTTLLRPLADYLSMSPDVVVGVLLGGVVVSEVLDDGVGGVGGIGVGECEWVGLG